MHNASSAKTLRVSQPDLAAGMPALDRELIGKFILNDKQNDAGFEPQKTQAQFSFRSVLIIVAVCAAVAASLAHLWRAANGDQQEIGQFVVITAMSPLLLLVVASWVFRFARYFLD